MIGVYCRWEKFCDSFRTSEGRSDVRRERELEPSDRAKMRSNSDRVVGKNMLDRAEAATFV